MFGYIVNIAVCLHIWIISLSLISLSQESTVRNFRRHATHVPGSTNQDWCPNHKSALVPWSTNQRWCLDPRISADAQVHKSALVPGCTNQR